ncbi:angiogenic factor with G patch and FHA domains 1 isoform X1 [Drosophila persimilis]|uniref:angiogenic factor with G patch and FHA domains 1 isoform X1 n=1 Tax=Drosophila persimilis TaxID=7234 RepID=UPI000F07A2F9|nr:angiogenic factor with G patch and FHA domains 1 isoform X1 [Drosophila persimilis]
MSVAAEAAAGEDSSEAASEHDFIQLKSMQDVEACDQRQLYQYIEKLHGIIRKYDTRLAANKQKLKQTQLSQEKKLSHTALQSSIDSDEEEVPGKSEKKETAAEFSATDAFSFVDEMRQAAKHAENLNNFVYEPTSGMYYDPKTGYYYNAEYDLYYDGNTGCYYSYDHGKDSYEFHSQAQVQANDAAKPGSEPARHEDDEDDEVEFDELGGVITDTATLQKIKTEKQKLKERAEKSKRRAKKKKNKKHSKKKNKKERCRKPKRKRRNADDNGDAEDGELSESSDSSSSSNSSDNDSSSSASEDDGSVPVFKAAGRFQDIAKKYPPSLRIIVQETNVEELLVGSLHLITYKGGSLGREGEHDVIIPDVNVSKSHLEFYYEAKSGIYRCRDLGSRNGTVLNGMRMASDPMDLVHGSVVTIGQTKLLCHVHEGNSTCGLCEPGLLIETQAPVSATALSSTATVLSHKEQLKKLQKKYGLENEKFVEASGNGQQKPNYNDRAATRRVNVGSSTDKEKTEVACVHTEIASSNKGFKMLSKLGWQKGNTLGKTNASAGLLTPINVVANEGTSGLGRGETISASRPVDKRKMANLKITQARYQRANDIFELSGESD